MKENGIHALKLCRQSILYKLNSIDQCLYTVGRSYPVWLGEVFGEGGVIGEEEVEGDKFWMGRSFKKGIRGQRILEEMERD